MPQQERISRDLEFVGDAKHTLNVKGPMGEEMHHLHDHFDQISLDSARWTGTTPVSGDSVAISAGVGGLVLLTAGNADDDSCGISSQLVFEGAKNCIAEARLKVPDIGDTALFFGFAETIAYSNNAMPIAYDSNSVTSGATDAAGFVLDKDASSLGSDEWLCAAVYNNNDATNVSSGETAVSDEWVDLRVELKLDAEVSSTNAIANFFINGVAVGHITTAIVAATDLCVCCWIENRDSVNGTAKIDRIDVWQEAN